MALAITIGDPTGIGPEILAKVLQLPLPDALHLYGDIAGLEQTAHKLGLSLPVQKLTMHPVAISVAMDDPAWAGQVAYTAIAQAVADIRAGTVKSLVTGPINKANLQKAGFNAQGHTEILEELAQHHWQDSSLRSEMLFVYRGFRLLLLTRHVPLNQVSTALTIEGVLESLRRLIQFLQRDVGIETPRLAMLAVNPHAGEIGGHEETDILRPAMAQLIAETHVVCEGPFPADGFFRGFSADTCGYDAIVSPYHDQGLIPFKLLAGYEAVNVTIGLPFLRTSVSHGTADDIVGLGQAEPDSLIAALALAQSF